MLSISMCVRFDLNCKNSMIHELHVSLTWIIGSTQNLTNDISIKSSLDAEHNDIRFSFVRPTSAAKKLKATRKHIQNWMHSVKYSTL